MASVCRVGFVIFISSERGQNLLQIGHCAPIIIVGCRWTGANNGRPSSDDRLIRALDRRRLAADFGGLEVGRREEEKKEEESWPGIISWSTIKKWPFCSAAR